MARLARKDSDIADLSRGLTLAKQACFEALKLGEQALGHPIAELRVVLADQRDLLEPARYVNVHQGVQSVLGQVEPVEVQRTRCGQEADRRLYRFGVVVATFEDPFENTRVLGETRPDELDFVVLTVQVDVDDLLQLGDFSLAYVQR